MAHAAFGAGLGRAFTCVSLAIGLMLTPSTARGEPATTIDRVKMSVVAIGTFERTRAPAFQFLGTGFAVGDGSLIATDAHLLPGPEAARGETLAILLPATAQDGKAQVQVREARRAAVDLDADLALLKISGSPLPALALFDSDRVREGQEILLTGFPIGDVLGPSPATHRGIVAAITPIAIPQARAADLDPATLRRLSAGSFPVFQLDATAYPGNSGSPVYDPQSGEVLGIVNMVLVKGARESGPAQPGTIFYAVPTRHLKALLDKTIP
jgi:S1-C subfamily serine protease